MFAFEFKNRESERGDNDGYEQKSCLDFIFEGKKFSHHSDENSLFMSIILTLFLHT